MADTPNLKDTIRRAKRLGVMVDQPHATGEVRFLVPGEPRPMTVNNRRKSAPKALLKLIRRYESSEREDQR